MKSKVSVIVPVYNVEAYLERCICSLLDQSLAELELIFVNDGSTDGTGEILKKYQEQYPDKIKIKTTENRGAAAARNEGLRLAEGEYIGFVDGDDTTVPSMFEELYQEAVASESDIVCCGYRRIDGDDVQIRGTDEKTYSLYGKSIVREPEILIDSTPYLWNKIFRRSMIEKRRIVFENYPIYEDLIFTYQSFLYAEKIGYVPQPLYQYTVSRDGSLTASFSKKRFVLLQAFDSLLAVYDKEGMREQFRDELFFILMKHVYVACEERAGLSVIGEKFRYINASFAYMRKVYPDLASYKRYYTFYQNKKSKYENRLYWYARTCFPWMPEIRRRLGKIKRALPCSRGGVRYHRACCENGIDQNLILIQPQQGKNLNGNMFYLLKELCNNPAYAGYKKVIACDAQAECGMRDLLQTYGMDREDVMLQRMHTKVYTRALAQAKYLFNDTSFPTYFTKREGQVYLNTWHGTPLKTLGKATAKDYYDIANLQKNFCEADYLLYPSRFMRDVMVRDFMLDIGMQGKILYSGYPRNEIFFDRTRAKEIRKKEGLEEKQLLAYMPTWRGNVRAVDQGRKTEVQAILEAFDQGLREDQILYVNLHPYVQSDIFYDKFSHIRKFPKEYETYDFLNCCDGLITDYSSVFFDYSVTGKPIVLYTYDKEDYLRDRGMYLDIDALPWVQTDTVAGVLENLNRAVDENIRKDYEKTYISLERPHMSCDILRQVILGEDAALQTETLPAQTKRQALLLVDPVSEPAATQLLVSTAKELQEEGFRCVVGYDTKRLIGYQSILKKLPEGCSYMGSLHPFCQQSLWEGLILVMTERHPALYRLFRKRLHGMMQREIAHKWPGSSFAVICAVGRLRIRELLLALNGHGRAYGENQTEQEKRALRSIYREFEKTDKEYTT